MAEGEVPLGTSPFIYAAQLKIVIFSGVLH
jgi:hypothetical protein